MRSLIISLAGFYHPIPSHSWSVCITGKNIIDMKSTSFIVLVFMACASVASAAPFVEAPLQGNRDIISVSNEFEQ
jgi:hypothetical protein